MFTGLVEALGTVEALEALDTSQSGGGGTSLTVSTAADPDFLKDAQLGDSICINGTCLTVTELPTPTTFKVGIAPETLRRTNLGSLSAAAGSRNARVNLERALLPHTRMGGHFLQGHVDSIATILETRPDGNAVTFRLAPRDPSVLRYVVEKGYVGLDGASLTVTAVQDASPGHNVQSGQGEPSQQGWFEVMLIAYTQEKIVMARKQAGDDVNVEVDMVGKYVEKSVAAYFAQEVPQVQQGGEGERSGSMRLLETLVGRLVDERLKQQQK